MLRKLLAAIMAMALGGSPVFAANVTLQPGPKDPSQLLFLVNTLIISGNQIWATAGQGNANTGLNITGTISATATVNNSTAVNALMITPTALLSATSGVSPTLGNNGILITGNNIVTIGPGNAIGGTGDQNVDLGLAPKGTGLVEFVRASSITPIGTATISLNQLANNSISPNTIVEFLMIKNPSGLRRFIPLWGCGAAGQSTC